MNVRRWSLQGALLAALGFGGFGTGCTMSEPEGTAIYLVDRFDEAFIEGAIPAETELPRIEWSFDQESEEVEWKALAGLANVKVIDDNLTGRTNGRSLLAVPGPAETDPNDVFHALEIKLKTAAGTRLGVSFESDEELDAEKIVDDFEDSTFFDFNIDLKPGDDTQTYTLNSSHARFRASLITMSMIFLLKSLNSSWFDRSETHSTS